MGKYKHRAYQIQRCSSDTVIRRRFLTTVSGIALAGVSAGCLGGGQDASTETATADESTAETTEVNETTTETNETTTGANETTTAGTDVEGEIADAPTALEVTNRELYSTDGEVGLSGTVENTGDETYQWVEAEVTLQDDQGDVLYEFVDESEEELTEGLKPGKTWQFDVVFEEANMADVRTYTLDREARTEALATGNTSTQANGSSSQ